MINRNLVFMLLFGTLILAACGGQPEPAAEEAESKSMAETFTATSEGASWDGELNVLNSLGDDEWANYTVNIEDAGRYRFEIVAMSTHGGSVWFEDYLGNPDDRTYNVTSEVKIDPSEEFTTFSVDGSPLNSGEHPMRLHIKGTVAIKDFSFTKLKDPTKF